MPYALNIYTQADSEVPKSVTFNTNEWVALFAMGAFVANGVFTTRNAKRSYSTRWTRPLAHDGIEGDEFDCKVLARSFETIRGAILDGIERERKWVKAPHRSIIEHEKLTEAINALRQAVRFDLS